MPSEMQSFVGILKSKSWPLSLVLGKELNFWGDVESGNCVCAEDVVKSRRAMQRGNLACPSPAISKLCPHRPFTSCTLSSFVIDKLAVKVAPPWVSEDIG